MENIIEIENLSKSYGKHRGVTDVSLNVQKGDIFGFLGPNGAGKSTTIRSMLGLINYDSGSIRVFGLDSRKNREQILKSIGYMPSEAWFYEGMTIGELLRLTEKVRKVDCSVERKRLLNCFDVDEKRKISELSLGNRKKVSIIAAMQHKPELFVFDEPTSGLDPLMQNTFFELIKEYVKNGATCLLSTHVLSEVKNHCNRVSIMKDGKVLRTDLVENLNDNASKRIKMVRNNERLDYLYTGELNDIYKEFMGYDITELTISEPSLEEIFMHYYEKEEK